MKRLTVILLIAMGVFFYTTIVFAGVWGTVTGFIKAEAVSVLIGAAVGALGMLGITYKLWGKAVKELGECIWKIYKATRESSPGGKSITKKEMADIIKEAQEIYPAVSVAIASHKYNL